MLWFRCTILSVVSLKLNYRRRSCIFDAGYVSLKPSYIFSIINAEFCIFAAELYIFNADFFYAELYILDMELRMFDKKSIDFCIFENGIFYSRPNSAIIVQWNSDLYPPFIDTNIVPQCITYPRFLSTEWFDGVLVLFHDIVLIIK